MHEIHDSDRQFSRSTQTSGLLVCARAESPQVIGIIDVNGVGKSADDSAPGKDADNF